VSTRSGTIHPDAIGVDDDAQSNCPPHTGHAGDDQNAPDDNAEPLPPRYNISASEVADAEQGPPGEQRNQQRDLDAWPDNDARHGHDSRKPRPTNGEAFRESSALPS